MFFKAMSQEKKSQPKSTKLSDTGCPVDREELGRQSWTMLHTMAAYYPDEPTDSEKQLMTQFITGLAQFYPCTHCAEKLRESLSVNPPTVNSREELVLWFCWAHNEVNKDLGLKVHPCKLDSLDRRWRYGRKGCFATDLKHDDDDDDAADDDVANDE